jgi:hypothetical protein
VNLPFIGQYLHSMTAIRLSEIFLLPPSRLLTRIYSDSSFPASSTFL